MKPTKAEWQCDSSSSSFDSPSKLLSVNDIDFLNNNRFDLIIRLYFYAFLALKVLQQIQNGKLLDCPRLCPEDVYKIMLGCWMRQPGDRLTMKEIHKQLEDLSAVPPVYLDVIA